jgi:hypothetical protein
LLALAGIMRSPVRDRAAQNTLFFGEDRRRLADWVNANNLKCYCEDSGLNIFLKEPIVLYPFLQNTYFRSGYLNKQSFLNQIRRKEFDLIVLTGKTWSYQDIESFPEEFMPLVTQYYQPSKYLVFAPKF